VEGEELCAAAGAAVGVDDDAGCKAVSDEGLRFLLRSLGPSSLDQTTSNCGSRKTER